MKIIAAEPLKRPRRKEEAEPQPPQPIQADPTPPPKTEFTQADLATYDFTGWDWRLLPHDLVKAARNGTVPGFTIVGHMECLECHRKMWTCDPKREDVCEADDYSLRMRNHELRAERAKRNNMKPITFANESDKPNRGFWPLEE